VVLKKICISEAVRIERRYSNALYDIICRQSLTQLSLDLLIDSHCHISVYKYSKRIGSANFCVLTDVCQFFKDHLKDDLVV